MAQAGQTGAIAIKEAPMSAAESITIRRATQDDASAVARLAQLEGVQPPVGEVLVGEVDGEPWAVVELEGGVVVADPFRPSGEVADLLRLRVRRLHEARPRGRPRGWRLRRHLPRAGAPC
jgi:hypothetical protein